MPALLQTPKTMDRHIAAIVLVLVVVGAFGLRIWRLGNPLVFSDEAFSWRVSTYPLNELTQSVANDTHPIGHFILLKAWIGLVGSTPFQIRVLSALLGTAATVVAYHLCSEAHTTDGPREGNGRVAGLLAALFVAIHVAQIEPGRTARMYALGSLLSGATSWCLVRALRGPATNARRWVLYALLVSAFLYTHNFAHCAFAAQFVFLILTRYRPIRRSGRLTPPRTSHLVIILGIVGLLYAPWIPNLAAQMARVNEGFWITTPSLVDLKTSFLFFAVGIRALGDTPFCFAGVVAFLACAIMGMRSVDLRVLFLLEALTPWLFTLAITYAAGTPILQDRYLTFAGFSLTMFVAYTVAHIKSDHYKHAAVIYWSLLCIWGGVEYFTEIPDDGDAAVEMIADMKAELRASDLVVLADARSLNVFRYYMAQDPRVDREFRCLALVSGPGHTNHASSLKPDDVIPDTHHLSGFDRVWVINHALQPDADMWKRTSVRYYRRSDSTFEQGIEVELYEMQKAKKQRRS